MTADLTDLITHGLAFAAGVSAVIVTGAVVLGGRGDDRENEMWFQEEEIGADPLELGPPEGVQVVDLQRITPEERQAITDDALAAVRRVRRANENPGA